MLVDSHCHLDRLELSKYPGGLSEALDAARAAGVSRFLNVCISLGNFQAVLEVAEREPDVFASLGVHPCDVENPLAEVEALCQMAQHPRVVAIGETGLDYYHDRTDRALQQESFSRHMAVASKVGLPVIVHTREAREDTLAMIRQHADVNHGGVLHCFTESWEMAKAALDYNFYVSFSGIISFRNAEELRQVARQVPLDRLLVETDSPYLAPVPHRGKPNQPKFVLDVAKCLAELRGMSLEALAEQTTENFQRLFPKAG